MTVRDLFNTLFIGQMVCLCSKTTFVASDNIPEVFIPYLDKKISEIEIEMEITGQCCGIDTESPILYIYLKHD